MSQWKKVRIGDFLVEREGRYKPDDIFIAKYQRLDKIDFSGAIHLSNKPTKTDMILVYPGDLVLSGINVSKGAITVYQGKEPVCATIHYSAYTFDDSKVNLDYFKFFVKSPAFVETLKQQVKGGIKTEIKPKHLLPLEIAIPELSVQKQIVKTLSAKLANAENLALEIEKQKAYTKLLLQNILLDAIEGKLTVDWRKSHPVIKGNPDYDAETLFEKIQEEKDFDKKQKKLPPITEEEKPFEIPEEWKWVRLGEVAEIIGGYAFNSYDLKETGDNFVLRLGNIRDNQIRYDAKPAFISNSLIDNLDDYKTIENDILLTMTGTRGKKDYLYSVKIKKEHQDKCSMFVNQRVCIIRPLGYVDFILNCLHSEPIKEPIFDSATGSANQANIGIKALNDWVLPFPPLKEQEEIVNIIESLLAKVIELENQIQERKTLSEKLAFGIIKEKLEG